MSGFQSRQMGFSIPPTNGQIAAGLAGNSQWGAIGGGGLAGSIGAGGPVWTSNNGAASVGVGAFGQYGRGIPSNAGVGVGLKFRF